MRYSFSPPSFVEDGELPVAADEPAELDQSVDLGDDGGRLGPPRLEQLLGPRQTSRDVLGSGDLAGYLGQDVAGVDLVAVLDLQVGARRQVVLAQHRRTFPSVLVLLLRRVDDLDPGLQLFVLGLDDDLGDQAGELVLDLLHASHRARRHETGRRPPSSVRMKVLNGSHSAKTWRALTSSPSLTRTLAP